MVGKQVRLGFPPLSNLLVFLQSLETILNACETFSQIWYLCQEVGKQPEDAKWVSLESLKTRQP